MAGLFDYEYQLDEIKKHQPPLEKLNEIIRLYMLMHHFSVTQQKENSKHSKTRILRNF